MGLAERLERRVSHQLAVGVLHRAEAAAGDDLRSPLANHSSIWLSQEE
jgi:hypothetical protein